MKIIAIDTSSNICSVALLENDTVVKELSITNNKTHSENLMPLIQELLQNAQIELKNINLIACCIGPGSFTGIRIGISTVKAMALVYDIPIVGVTSLECLAYNVTSFKKTICSLIDARNNQVYCGIFNENYVKEQEYIADDINNVINELKTYENITFVGDGSILHKNLLLESFENIVFAINNIQNAVNIGKCAYAKFNLGDKQDADTIAPIYLRKSQAERMKDLNG